jgi:hypothetical protein
MIKEEQDLNNTENPKFGISDVSDSEIIVGNYYDIEKYDTKVVVLAKDDTKNKAKVTADLVSETSGFWINYNKLVPFKNGKIFTNKK